MQHIAIAQVSGKFTGRAYRTAKPHVLNIPVYAQIALVLALTAIAYAWDFIEAQAEQAPARYELVANTAQITSVRFQLAKTRTHRRFVRIAIRAEQVRLTAAPRLVAVMDRIFCLEG